jgi:hypothetical protein
MIEPPRPIRPSGASEPDEEKDSVEAKSPPSREKPSGEASPAPVRKNAPDEAASTSLPSVRDLMGDPRSEPEPEGAGERAFEVRGREWTARVIGSRKSGAPGDAGAPLLLVRFMPTGGEGGALEGWVVSLDLERVGDHALADALKRARPARD